MAVATELYAPSKSMKKTRQGLGRGTRWGNKNSKRYGWPRNYQLQIFR